MIPPKQSFQKILLFHNINALKKKKQKAFQFCYMFFSYYIFFKHIIVYWYNLYTAFTIHMIKMPYLSYYRFSFWHFCENYWNEKHKIGTLVPNS